MWAGGSNYRFLFRKVHMEKTVLHTGRGTRRSSTQFRPSARMNLDWRPRLEWTGLADLHNFEVGVV
jgi:hypothetical protein